LTGYNFVYGPYGADRGRGVVANSSWLWPWLTPVMGMGLAAIFAKNWVLKGIGLTLFIVCAWASLSVMQRGGYLIVGIFISILIILFLYCFGKKWSKKYALLIGGVGALGLGIFVYSSTIMNILRLLRHFGIEIRRSDLLYFDNRLIVWDLAWQSVQEHPWFGTGYGTWLREFSKFPGSGSLSFDTAHNLWIQMIFELGLIHTVALVIILGMLVLTTLIYKNFDHPSLRIGGLFLTIGKI
jgi:O-antigen ligase